MEDHIAMRRLLVGGAGVDTEGDREQKISRAQEIADQMRTEVEEYGEKMRKANDELTGQARLVGLNRRQRRAQQKRDRLREKARGKGLR